jgi:hypothetical protein
LRKNFRQRYKKSGVRRFLRLPVFYVIVRQALPKQFPQKHKAADRSNIVLTKV